MVNNEDAASADSDNSWEKKRRSDGLQRTGTEVPSHRSDDEETRRSAGDSLAEELAEETAIHKLCPCGDEPES
jgi:hypothetical protein